MHSFRVIFTSYERTSPTLQDLCGIQVSGIVLVRKHSKVGDLEINKTFVQHVDGKFKHVAGSNRYPILWPKGNKVTIYVRNFPDLPILELGTMPEYKSHVQIKMGHYD